MAKTQKFSRGFASPAAVIFLAIISLVSWYMNHNKEDKTAVATSSSSRLETGGVRASTSSSVKR